MEDTKAAIRRAMRRRRRALTAGDVAAAGEVVTRHAQALVAMWEPPALIAYVATDNEVPTGALITWAQAARLCVLLPRLVGETMEFAEYRGDEPLRVGACGIPAPAGRAIPAARLKEAFAVIPLLAWDAAGGRVGRGSGHFDRVFAEPCRPRWLVGLSYGFQQVPRVPCDPWDIRLDAVISERGVHDCRAGERAAAVQEGVGDDDEVRGVGSGQPRVGRVVGGAAGRPPTAEN